MPQRRLDPRAPYKPLDVGNGIVAGSLNSGGRWLDLGIAHPVHGRVIVTDAPAYVGDRLDPRAVRAYRATLASRDREGFGLALLERASSAAALVEDTFPLAIHARRDARIESLAFAPSGRRGAAQVLRIDARRDMRIEPAWTGTMRLARAAYTQLTPGGALPDAEEHPILGHDGRVLWIADEGLGVAVAVALPPPLEIPAGASDTLAVAIALAQDADSAVREAIALAGAARELMPPEIARRRALWTGLDLARPAQRPQRRAFAYAVDCAASEIGSDAWSDSPAEHSRDAASRAIAVLADHEILPLVWTRDAYYVCRALLALDPRGAGRTITAAFLHWCFETAERVDGWWPRASLASGAAKDPVFQLDQQLYPLLLLEDLARLAGDDAPLRAFRAQRDRVIAAILEQRTAHGLVATAETPADDPIDAPFHFSSHVLLWRVLRDLDRAHADAVRAASLR
ncbi:MAG TPA: hypothetical protein VM052_05975, partial [Candidatus Limnocylindrales bacterium]|nr:hypothetical protein [Candidatus Limnocylindrales bacterium]